jgi:hypothetical protein
MNQDEIKKVFYYTNGKLYNQYYRSSNAKKDAESGCLDGQGYRIVKFNKKYYKTHRLIWIMHYGDISRKLEIDHINGIRDDNRIENLRLVTHQENQFNRPNVKGYCWNKNDQRWQSYICVDSKTKHLGSFISEEDARQAYLDAKNKQHVIEKKKIG